MKFAYPQNPSAAVSTVRRFDETSDALTQQSDLDRKQSVALIGETVPMVFCSRGNFGNEQGINGGVWVSPKLVQLGLEGERLSMMYLLSQGKLTGVDPENVFWGQEKLLAQDDSAEFCTGYQEIPPCLELEYIPGAELGWTQTVVKAGPQGAGSFTTEPNCRKINIAWNSQISVSGSGTTVSGFGGTAVINEVMVFVEETCEFIYRQFGYDRNSPWKGDLNQGSMGSLFNSGQETYGTCNTVSAKCGIQSCVYGFDMSTKHAQSSWYQTSEVRFDWSLIRVSDEEIVQSGQIWVQDGSTSLLIDGLEPDKYRLLFSNTYAERNAPISVTIIPDPGNSIANFASSYLSSYTGGPGGGFRRHTSPGSETRNISCTITQTLYTELVLPDLPGGDTQLVGGLFDLTMAGIEGNILNLRPVGIDRFLQAHVFVEQGIEVERLLDGETGSSRLYADLVKYLMSTTKILQQDQIDIEALTLSAQMNQAYSIFFNGILQTTNSLAEWITRTAPYFLLSARQVDGKYGLLPVCPLGSNGRFKTTPIEPAFIITSDQILEGSYSRQYMSNKDRRPVCLVMVYRDQPTAQIGQTVTIEARYPGTALSGPFEQHDMTEFCCRGEHAVYAARYILAKRRHTTHVCQLSIGRQGRAIKPGDIVRVDLNLQTSDGAGISDSVMYQVESVNEGQEGTVQLELLHFPVDENGASLVAQEVDAGSIVIS